MDPVRRVFFGEMSAFQKLYQGRAGELLEDTLDQRLPLVFR